MFQDRNRLETFWRLRSLTLPPTWWEGFLPWGALSPPGLSLGSPCAFPGPPSPLCCTRLITSWTLVATIAISTQPSYQKAFKIEPTIKPARKQLQPAGGNSSQPRLDVWVALGLPWCSWALPGLPRPHSGPLSPAPSALITRVLGHKASEMNTGT